MKTLGFRKYCVQVEVQDDVMEFAVPARSKDEAKLYVEDAGRVIAVEDITDRKPISVDKVVAALHKYGFEKTEIELITRTLLVTNIAD